jgi:hypothetical protein
MSKYILRDVLDALYDMQKLRIASGNRLCQIFKDKSDADSTIKDEIEKEKQKETDSEEVLDVKADEILKTVNSEYKELTAYMMDNNKTIASALKKIETIKILTKTDYSMVKAYNLLLESEESYKKVLEANIKDHPVFTGFLSQVKGCGPMMSANIIAYLDPYKARHASSFRKYAGLDVVTTKDKDGNPVVDEDGNIVTHGRKMGDTEDYEYIDKNGNKAIKKGLTYNPKLKSKLIGVLASGIIKAKDPVYTKIYYDYKLRLENHPKHKDKSAAHRNNMALRYMIQKFLSNLWVYWRTLEGLEVTEPYEVAKLGMRPHGFNDGDIKRMENQSKQNRNEGK